MNPEMDIAVENTTEEKIRKFENALPLLVIEWHDAETYAHGWLIINSLRGGAAGGGTRMRKGLTKHEVVSLAKTMEIKFTVSGPPIGGAKSGINFDPEDPRKQQVLERWFHAIKPYLAMYYGTGGDLNVDDGREVTPTLLKLGIPHPQYGVVEGHYQLGADESTRAVNRLMEGITHPVTAAEFAPRHGHFTVADLITGWGVAEAVHQWLELKGEQIAGKRVLIQGWGNVSGAAGLYLARHGAILVGILDKDRGVIAPEGLSLQQVEELLTGREGNALGHEGTISHEEADWQFWNMQADIFVPAASSRLIHKNHLEQLLNGGLRLIAPGANVPFADQEIFMGAISQWADQHFTVLPDFIANSGMARAFYYFEQPGALMSVEALFRDVTQAMHDALVPLRSREKGIMEAAYEIALQKIGF